MLDPQPHPPDVELREAIVDGKTVCVVSCQRNPEPVFLK